MLIVEGVVKQERCTMKTKEKKPRPEIAVTAKILVSPYRAKKPYLCKGCIFNAFEGCTAVGKPEVACYPTPDAPYNKIFKAVSR